MPIWDGPVEHMPWWWTYILQLEKRVDGLLESAAFDPEHKYPPKEIWPLSKHKELEDWNEDRRKLSEEKAKEKQALSNW